MVRGFKAQAGSPGNCAPTWSKCCHSARRCRYSPGRAEILQHCAVSNARIDTDVAALGLFHIEFFQQLTQPDSDIEHHATAGAAARRRDHDDPRH